MLHRCNVSGESAPWSRYARLFLLCVVFSGPVITPAAIADGLDRWRVAGLITSVSQEIAQTIPGVHLHIINPSDYLGVEDQTGNPKIDISALTKRIGGELTAPLDFPSALRISREAVSVLYRGEMATTLHALSDHDTICLVFPSAGPLQLSALASSLSGRDESALLAEVSFDAADFFRFLLYHEVAHCAEDAWLFRVWNPGAHEAYLAEARADAFATLMYVRRTADMTLPRFISDLRRAGAQHRADFAHQTADVMGPSLSFAMNLHQTKMLEDRTVAELLFAARVFVQKHALSREKFEQAVAMPDEKPSRDPVAAKNPRF